jgi:hypothetical protein
MIKISLLSLLIVSCLCANVHHDTNLELSDLQSTIKEIYKTLKSQQQPHNQDFSYFPLKLKKLKGLYHSFIKMNFVDDTNSWAPTAMRRIFNIYDLNMS